MKTLQNLDKSFSYICLLNSNEFAESFDGLLGYANSKLDFKLEKLQDFPINEKLFGLLSYELKNKFEKLQSKNESPYKIPDFLFFQPEEVHLLSNLEIAQLLEQEGVEQEKIVNNSIHLQQKISKKEYLQKVKSILEHIQRGDIYEMNFCMEFFAKGIDLDPVQLYTQLNHLSPSPFSSFFKADDLYVLCSSPERFLKKKDRQLISQPIKGTIKRSLDKAEDEHLKVRLFNDPKERSENVMIVDLVRNDLSRVCEIGSVKVDELFGIYTFPQVHQMISTISGKLNSDVFFFETLKALFPMGSMTGAPKIRAMELIDKYEESKRGIYSGSIGYIDAKGDFDFNVVIRSILYNKKTKHLSFQVGSAITIHSNPELEYEECMLKASAILKVLGMD